MQLLGSQTITGQLLLTDTGLAASVATLVVQGASGQTGNQQEWRNSNGSVQAAIGAAGQFVSNGVAPSIAGLGTPVITAVTPTGTVGTTTYGYRVAAYNAAGTTIASTEVTTSTGNAGLSPTNYNLIQWNLIGGATGYRIYGRTAGLELLMTTVAYPATSFIDDGSLTPAGALPAAPAGSTFNIQQWNSQTGPILRVLQYGGGTTFFQVSGSTGNTVMNSGATLAGTAGGGVLASSLAMVLSASTKGIGMQTAAAQTADALSIMDINGNTMARIGGANGAFQNYGTYAYIGGLLTPNPPTLATVGTPGSTTYGYRIAALSAQSAGITVASTETTIATGNAVLDTNNYINVTWSSAVGVAAYRVYGRTAGAELLMATVVADGRVGTYTYADQGVATPSGALPGTTGSTTLTVQGWGSQAAGSNLANFLDGAGNTLASITAGLNSTGVIQAWVASVGAAGLRLGSTPGNPNAPAIDLTGYGNGVTGAGSLLRIVNNNIAGTPVQVAMAGNIGLIVTPGVVGSPAIAARGITGQTGNIQEWQDPTGASALAVIDSQGRYNGPTAFVQSVKDPTTLQGSFNLVTVGYAFDLSAGTGSVARATARLRMAAAQTADAFQVQDSTGAVLAKIGNTGLMSSVGFATSQAQLATPVIASVTNVGTAGSTTYGYRVSALNAAGETVASAEVTTATGNATLTVTNYNTVTWSAVTGATGYRVYGRYVGAEALLATVGVVTSYNDTAGTYGGTVAAGLNPTPNSSLNINTTGWQVTGCTIARDTTFGPPVPGVTSALFTSTVASGGCNTQTGNQSGFKTVVAVTASTQYTASAWVYLGTMPSALIGVDWFDSTGAYITGAASGIGGVSTGWTRLTVTATSAGTAAYANLYIQGNETAIGQTMWFAAPQIDPGAFAQSYQLDLPRGTGMLYEGTARVYSANNPQPSVATSTAVQIASGTIIPATLASPWSNNLGGNAAASYQRDAQGWVHLSGTIFANGSAVTVPGNIVTGLPVPSDGATHSFTINDFLGTTHVLAISAVGTLYLVENTVASNNTIGLDGINYYAGGSSSTYVAGPALAVPTDVPHVATVGVGWSALGGTWAVPKYIVTAGGLVYLQGIVVAGSTYGAGSGPLTGLPLPADGLAHIFTAYDTVGGVATVVQLRQDGVLLNQAPITSGHNLCLDGIVYLTSTAGNAGFASSSFATSVKFGSER